MMERDFVERMRDVSLVGSFTVFGQADLTPSPDRYDISSVEKVGTDLWRFQRVCSAAVVNGAGPVVVPMRWNGDTPIIMMTETTLPGLGTFTVRLFFGPIDMPAPGSIGERSGSISGRIESNVPPPWC